MKHQEAKNVVHIEEDLFELAIQFNVHYILLQMYIAQNVVYIESFWVCYAISLGWWSYHFLLSQFQFHFHRALILNWLSKILGGNQVVCINGFPLTFLDYLPVLTSVSWWRRSLMRKFHLLIFFFMVDQNLLFTGPTCCTSHKPHQCRFHNNWIRKLQAFRRARKKNTNCLYTLVDLCIFVNDIVMDLTTSTITLSLPFVITKHYYLYL